FDGGKGKIGSCGIGNIAMDIKNFTEAAHGSGGTLYKIGYPAYSDHRPDEQIQVDKKLRQFSEGHLSGDNLAASYAEHKNLRQARQKDHGRHNQRLNAGELEIFFQIGF